MFTNQQSTAWDGRARVLVRRENVSPSRGLFSSIHIRLRSPRIARTRSLQKAAGLLVLLVSGVAALAGEAVLRAGDTIELKLGGVPSNDTSTVSGTYMIDGDGYVNMPNLGKVRIGGFTAGAAQTAIENEYRAHDIYTHPTIILTMQVHARWVNVGGEVKSPQRVAYTPDLTVLAAINAAGGFSAFADQRRVRLLRSDQVIMVDIRKVRATPSLDVAVEPGDSIEVPQTIF